jgi:uncharacterized protein with HEPN domain
MTRREYADYLRDIQEAASKARRFVENVTFDEFVVNDEKVYAVMQALQIIGEAAKMIPPTARKRYPQIPWREVAGMRDKLPHGYFTVDVRRLWQTVQDDLPPLQRVIEQMLSDLESK